MRTDYFYNYYYVYFGYDEEIETWYKIEIDIIPNLHLKGINRCKRKLKNKLYIKYTIRACKVTT